MPNSGAARTGSLTIAGQTLTVTRPAAACSYVLSSTTVSASAAGGALALTLTTGAGCTWAVTSNANWINVTSAAGGAGNTTITLSVQANSGAARTGTVSVGGQTITVTQQAGGPGGCAFTLSAASVTAPASGLKGSVTLNASTPNCTWTGVSNRSWAELYPLSGTGTTAVSYTIYPNFGTSQRTATFNLGGRTFTVTQAAGIGTANERFVAQMYFNFFGRLASSSEMGFHVGTLNSISRAGLIMNFMNSDEFNNGGRFIAGLYVGLLARNAEYGGWLFQRNALSTSVVNPFQLVTNFVDGAEWKLRFGTPNNQEFVRLLYRYVLLREASQHEVDLQVGALTGGVTRVQLATAFLNTAEFRQGTGARLTAFLLYALLLQRDPTETEMNSRIAQLSGGTPIANIVQEIVASSEFGTLLQ